MKSNIFKTTFVSNWYKYVFAFFGGILLVSCGAINPRIIKVGENENGIQGVIQTDAQFNSGPPVDSLVIQYCKSKGMLGPTGVWGKMTPEESQSWPVRTRSNASEVENLQWKFVCKRPPVVPVEVKLVNPENVQKSTNENAARNIDSSKLQCQELGFETGTEAFGKCVLKLSK